MIKIEATADELRALVELTNRAPFTTAEALFLDALFSRWLATVEAHQSPAANGVNGKAPAKELTPKQG